MSKLNPKISSGSSSSASINSKIKPNIGLGKKFNYGRGESSAVIAKKPISKIKSFESFDTRKKLFSDSNIIKPNQHLVEKYVDNKRRNEEIVNQFKIKLKEEMQLIVDKKELDKELIKIESITQICENIKNNDKKNINGIDNSIIKKEELKTIIDKDINVVEIKVDEQIQKNINECKDVNINIKDEISNKKVFAALKSIDMIKNANLNYSINIGVKFYYKDSFKITPFMSNRNNALIDFSILKQEQINLFGKYWFSNLSMSREKIHFSLISDLYMSNGDHVISFLGTITHSPYNHVLPIYNSLFKLNNNDCPELLLKTLDEHKKSLNMSKEIALFDIFLDSGDEKALLNFIKLLESNSIKYEPLYDGNDKEKSYLFNNIDQSQPLNNKINLPLSVQYSFINNVQVKSRSKSNGDFLKQSGGVYDHYLTSFCKIHLVIPGNSVLKKEDVVRFVTGTILPKGNQTVYECEQQIKGQLNKYNSTLRNVSVDKIDQTVERHNIIEIIVYCDNF